MGESPKAEISVYSSEFELFSVETPWGRIHIRWDNEANATPNAQLAFFAEFLATAGLYESWVSSCPLSYSSGIVSHKRDVVGTWFLSILAGHHRYAHITGLRGDGVSPQILGMSKIVSEDSLRRALARMTADESQNWLRPQLLCSVQGALDTPWILDIDTTVKTLFGKQSGAEVSYNPHKPGRPSHALHTYFVSHLRMVLDVVVSPGKQHTAAHARPGLSDVLDSLNKEQLPALVRGDCGFPPQRQTQKSVGLGRLYHSGHRTLPEQRSGCHPDLQLVELVLPGGQAKSQNGSHYQPGVAAGRRGSSHQTCGTDDPLSDHNARLSDCPYVANRQYPSGSKPCKKSCGAVARDRPMEDPDGLHRGQNHSASTPKTPQNMCALGWVTAVLG
jgi:hypothetical protein